MLFHFILVLHFPLYRYDSSLEIVSGHFEITGLEHKVFLLFDHGLHVVTIHLFRRAFESTIFHLGLFSY